MPFQLLDGAAITFEILVVNGPWSSRRPDRGRAAYWQSMPMLETFDKVRDALLCIASVDDLRNFVTEGQKLGLRFGLFGN